MATPMYQLFFRSLGPRAGFKIAAAVLFLIGLVCFAAAASACDGYSASLASSSCYSADFRALESDDYELQRAARLLRAERLEKQLLAELRDRQDDNRRLERKSRSRSREVKVDRAQRERKFRLRDVKRSSEVRRESADY